MLDKSKLGARFTCFQCGTKFYDLNRPTSNCPECKADQSDAPVQDFRRMLSSRKRKPEKEEAPPVAPTPADEDDDLGKGGESNEDEDGIGVETDLPEADEEEEEEEAKELLPS